MPVTEPFIDLATLKVTTPLMRRADIEQVIPHRGVMLMLDEVLWMDSTCDLGVAVKRIRDDEFWVSGHIPGFPLMPGVLMIEAGAQLASLMYYKRSAARWFAGFTRIENTVFRGMVVPGDDFYLLCRCVKYNIKRFISEVQGVVNGQVVFESLITGMAFPSVQWERPVLDAGKEATEGVAADARSV